MAENYKLIDNEEKHQYEFHIESYTPRIEYIKSSNGEIYLTHTEVPAALGGARNRFSARRKSPYRH